MVILLVQCTVSVLFLISPIGVHLYIYKNRKFKAGLNKLYVSGEMYGIFFFLARPAACGILVPWPYASCTKVKSMLR